MPGPQQSDPRQKNGLPQNQNTPAQVIPMKKKALAKSSLESGAASLPNAVPGLPEASKVAASAPDGSARAAESAAARWTFLTNHSHVLILISRNPDAVLRQVAIRVGITERAVQRIIADLEEAGILEREKVGRQNRYRIIADQPLRHSIESHRTIADLLSLMEVNVG